MMNFGLRSNRALHPVAWWIWAGWVCVAASQLSNLALLTLISLALGWVVMACKPAVGPANEFSMFLKLGLSVIAIRVILQCLFVGATGQTILFNLPEIPLPQWMAGVRLGGPVTAEAALAALTEGVRLAVILLCFGAANTLAPPARLLRYLPRGLQSLGVALTVSLGASAALAAAFARIHRARRLRGMSSGGFRGALTIVGPVLEEALDRALVTASALDARGFGRRQSNSSTWNLSLLAGPGVLVAGSYLLLTAVMIPGILLVAVGLILGWWGFHQIGIGVNTSLYSPDQWSWAELGTIGCGVGSAGLTWLLPSAVAQPDPWVLATPQLTGLGLALIILILLPGLLISRQLAPRLTAPELVAG